MENQSDINEQSIADGQGFQAKDSTAPIVQGNQNTVNIYQSAPPPAAPTGSGTPQNLPYTGVVAFVGREEELELLHKRLQQRSTVAISAIAGMGGIGKTELALQYARKHCREGSYPGGLCWLRAREEVGTQIISFVRSCLDSTPPDDLELVEKVRWCWGRWHEGAVLLVFDDVQKYEEIASFLPPPESRFKVLMTSRSHFGSPVQALQLDVLSEEKALELLRALVRDDRIDQQIDRAKELCEWLGYLPLGVELVGRYLAEDKDLSLQELWKELQDQRIEAEALKQVEPGMTASLGVLAAFELSWKKLTVEAQQLAGVLSLFALVEIPWNLVQQCLPEVNEETLKKLRNKQLLKLNLLKRVEQGMYQLHQLLREFFAMKQEQRADVEKLKRRFYEVVVAEAEKVREKRVQSLIQESTLMIAHLQAATEFLNTPEQELNLSNCIYWIAALYEVQGRFSEAEPLYLQVLDWHQRQFNDDNLDRSHLFNNLAHLYDWQGRYSEAEPLYIRALEIRQQHLGNNHPHVASSLNNLAVLYRTQKRYSEAEPAFLQSLNILQKHWGNDHPNVATSLNHLAVLYEHQGRYEEAESFYSRSLEMRRRLFGDNHDHVATSFNNLGGLYCSQGRQSEAEPLLLKALSIHQEQLGADHPNLARTMGNLAYLYDLQGRQSEAESLYLQALLIFSTKLGESHPMMQKDAQRFRSLLQKAIQENRTDELSDDPMTRSLLQELQAENDHPSDPQN
jgi:tetratricopeptide (TPR) repeat protein